MLHFMFSHRVRLQFCQISNCFGEILSNKNVLLRFCTCTLLDNDLFHVFALATSSMVRHLVYVSAIKYCNNAYKGLYGHTTLESQHKILIYCLHYLNYRST